MNDILMVLIVILCVVLGVFLGKKLFPKVAKVSTIKRDALKLANALRSFGLVMMPNALDDMVIGDAGDLIARIHDVAQVIEAGSDMIMKELEGTYERVLEKKLATPEGLALIKAKVAVIEARKQ